MLDTNRSIAMDAKDDNELEKEKKQTDPPVTENAYDRALRKSSQRDKKSSSPRGSSAYNDAINTAARLARTFEPILTAVRPYQDFVSQNSHLVETANLISASVQVPSNNIANTVASTLEMVADTVHPLEEITWASTGLAEALSSATKTMELLQLQSNLAASLQPLESSMTVFRDYVNAFAVQWNDALCISDAVKRSLAAPNFAMIRFFPDYSSYDLPRGSKRTLKSLSKEAAKKLTQTEEVLFDPKDKKFYHKDTPNCKVTANQVTVVASSLELFADISFDDLISFESYLMGNIMFPLGHSVGMKIFEIIEGWNAFIDFDDSTYYHARKLEEGQSMYLDQEMLKAPENVSSHGRYNMIGKSCYYIAETKEGAINEIRKHSGGKSPDIQVAGVHAVRSAKILDLSADSERGANEFLDHLRFTVENTTGIIVKEYLLPNFVAGCCKRLGIEGIKYKSTGYDCFVLWEDSYFEFVEGSREIIRG